MTTEASFDGVETSFMRRAIEAARRGRGTCEPNPMVGAVIVRDGEVVGVGHHADFGGPHAEVAALDDAGERARGADVYVTLEPCSTHGKTPPCTEALRRAGVRRVVWSVDDPNPDHAGRAMSKLAEADIAVDRGLLAAEGETLIASFRRSLARCRPYVVAKWAQTLDGRIADHAGESKWITGPEARTLVHAERARCDGILVGVETVLADDPSLTVRHVDGRSPTPIVFDSMLRTPVHSKLFDAAIRAPIIVAAPDASSSMRGELERRGARVFVIERDDVSRRLDVAAAARCLYDEGIRRLLVEGGGLVLGAFFAARLVDRVTTYVAARILGDANGRPAVARPATVALGEATSLRDATLTSVGNDWMIEAFPDIVDDD